MRTQDEIVARINSSDDYLGFTSGVLAGYLDYDHVRPLLKPEVTAEDWAGDGAPLPQDREAVVAEISDYMGFALEKALGHRGISANRSVEKVSAWVWLLGDEDHAAVDWDDYKNYGAPILKAVSERFGITHEDLADPEFVRMAQGLSCRDDCEEGCGR